MLISGSSSHVLPIWTMRNFKISSFRFWFHWLFFRETIKSNQILHLKLYSSALKGTLEACDACKAERSSEISKKFVRKVILNNFENMMIGFLLQRYKTLIDILQNNIFKSARHVFTFSGALLFKNDNSIFSIFQWFSSDTVVVPLSAIWKSPMLFPTPLSSSNSSKTVSESQEQWAQITHLKSLRVLHQKWLFPTDYSSRLGK